MSDSFETRAQEAATGLKAEIGQEQAATRLKSEHPELFPLVGRVAQDFLRKNPGMTVEEGWSQAMAISDPVIKPFLAAKEAAEKERAAASTPKYLGGPSGEDPYEELSGEDQIKQMLSDSRIDQT